LRRFVNLSGKKQRPENILSRREQQFTFPIFSFYPGTSRIFALFSPF